MKNTRPRKILLDQKKNRFSLIDATRTNRSILCLDVKQADEWRDPANCENSAGHLYTRTKRQLHLEVPRAHLTPLPNSYPFQERHLSLDQPIMVGRPATTSSVPTLRNAMFECMALSRNHALLWYNNGKFYIKDLNSTNGTFVNGQRLSLSLEMSATMEIHTCDIIQFGVDRLENSKKVSHDYIIGTVELFLPRREDATISHAAVSSQNFLQLSQNLQVKGTEEKILNLVPKEQHKILVDRLVSILKYQPNEVVEINQISTVYAQMHGHALRALDFGFTDLLELLKSMDSTLRIVIENGRTCVTLVERGVVHKFSLNLCLLLMENRDCTMSVQDLSELYQSRFGRKINLSLHLQDMASLVQIHGDFIRLTPLLVLARDLISLLQDHNGQVPFSNLGGLFQEKYGIPLCTTSYGYPTMYALLESLSDFFSLAGKKSIRLVYLNDESIGGSLPQLGSNNATSHGSHNKQMNSGILNDPIPSCAPSPSLEPHMTKGLGKLTIFKASFKQEQTTEEIKRTKVFASEVIVLMKHTPKFTIPLQKFMMMYQTHYKKNCKLSDYGFKKLNRLLEAIPDVIEIKGTGEDKILNLVRKEQHKNLVERLETILKYQPNEAVDINEISTVYAQQHGHALRASDFGFNDLLQLLGSMDSTLRIVRENGKTFVILVEHGVFHQISLNLCLLLMENRDCTMSVQDLSELYQSRFGRKINLSLHLQDMASLVQINGEFICLTPLLVLVRDIMLLLRDHEGQVSLSNLGGLFQQKYGVPIYTFSYGYPTMNAMLESLSDFFSLKGQKDKCMVSLNNESTGEIFGCLPREVFNYGERLLKKDSMTEGSLYTISSRESHQLRDCSSSVPSTSTANSEQQMYISSEAENVPSEQSCPVHSPTVIDAHSNHSAYMACHSNPEPLVKRRKP